MREREEKWEGIMEGRVEDIMMKDDLDMIIEGMITVDPLHLLPPSQEVNVVVVIIMLQGGIMILKDLLTPPPGIIVLEVVQICIGMTILSIQAGTRLEGGMSHKWEEGIMRIVDPGMMREGDHR